MENIIVDLFQLSDNSDMTVGSTETKSKYTSCIRINGKPILPPLINDERRKELNKFKQKAIELELKLFKEKNKSSNQIPGDVSSVKTLPQNRQSPPTRPATLNLTEKYPEKTYALSKSKTEGSLNQYSHTLHSKTQSSQKSSKIIQNIYKSTLEQRLAAEENVLVQNNTDKNQQSPILEEHSLLENSTDDSSIKSLVGKWSPLEVEQLNSLRIELSNKGSHCTDDQVQVSQDENQTTPETVTQSPSLIRQNSYTLLTPSPALLSFLESQKKDVESERSHSKRKTWDLTKAKRNWDSREREGCQSLDGDESSDEIDYESLRKYSSSLDDFSAIEKKLADQEYSEENSGTNDSESGCQSPDSVVGKKNIPKILKVKGRGRNTRLLKCVPSPNGNDPKVPTKLKNNGSITTQGTPDFVPLEIKTELSELSNLLMKMKVDHERQKKELEEKQQTEMKQLEIIFQRREAELLKKVENRAPSRKSRRSIYSQSLKGPIRVQEVDTRVMGDGSHNRSSEKRNSLDEENYIRRGRSKRPHSARDSHRQCYSIEDDGDCDRRTKSMEYNEANQDTDLDFSFQDDFMQSKDTTLNNEYILESDSISNFSSQSSTMSSENRPDLIPDISFRKYHEISSGEYVKYNQAATIITAAAKGFLTRRLLRTAHVQGLITTLKDAITCATQLHTASDIGESDIDLMRRLGRQIEAAWDAVYVVFFNTDIPTKMQLISADRERLKAAIAKTPMTEPRKKRISSATRKSLDRKKAGTIMSKSQTSANGCTRVRMCTKMTASYPSPYFSTKLK